jgi:hypothetical protein
MGAQRGTMQKSTKRLVIGWGGAAAIAAVLCMGGCERTQAVAAYQPAPPIDLGQQQPAPQVIYQQAPPTVVYEQQSSGDGLVTGMLLGHMLSGGGYHSGYRGGYGGYGGGVHQHTTIVHNTTNVYHAPSRSYRSSSRRR